MAEDVSPTQKLLRALFAIVVTAAVVVGTWYLMSHFLVRARP
jgi:predicted secreted protein